MHAICCRTQDAAIRIQLQLATEFGRFLALNGNQKLRLERSTEALSWVLVVYTDAAESYWKLLEESIVVKLRQGEVVQGYCELTQLKKDICRAICAVSHFNSHTCDVESHNLFLPLTLDPIPP